MSGNHSYFVLPKYMWISSIFLPFGFLWRYFRNYSSYFFLNFFDFFLFHFIMNFRTFLKLSGQCTWYQILTSNCPKHLKSAFFCKHYRQKPIRKKTMFNEKLDFQIKFDTSMYLWNCFFQMLTVAALVLKLTNFVT